MRFLNTWRNRVIIVSIFSSFAFIAWVRFESRIAETPRATEPVADATSIATPSTIKETRESAQPNNDVESFAPAPVGTRDDEVEGELEIKNSSLVILKVPFVSQAPFRIWDLPYKEFCEEASVYSLYLWKEKKPTPPADELDRALKDIQAWEIANLRTWEDTTAEETARILKEKFGYVNTKVVRDATLAQMKTELRAGRPIVVPAAGRKLESPYYRPPGPLYHMLVIIGFDDEREEFITNDVGTNTKGAGFRFSYTNLYEAMGDWNIATSGPDTSQKVMIVVE